MHPELLQSPGEGIARPPPQVVGGRPERTRVGYRKWACASALSAVAQIADRALRRAPYSFVADHRSVTVVG